MSRITTSTPSPEQVTHIIMNLRDADVVELTAYNMGIDSEGIRQWSSMKGTRIVSLDGVPVAMYGITGEGALRSPWLVGTDDLYKAPKDLHRFAKEVLACWMRKPGKLENLIHEHNTESIDWLEVLGFSVSDQLYQINEGSGRFRRFWMEA